MRAHPAPLDRLHAHAVAGGWPWLAAGAAVLAAAILIALWLRRRRRLVPRPLLFRRKAPRHPVVLAHGLLGFDEIRIGRARTDYFRGVSVRLEREGCKVHRCRVAKTASIAARAAELAAFVNELDVRRVNVVAHSMGGLDARFALARLGLGRKVASLVTIGTPHRGTPLADAGHGLASRSGLFGALRRIGMELDAFHDLTTARMEEFNREIEDVRGVHYGSVVGAPARRRDVSPILVPTFMWLGDEAGGNDGMVTAESQRWGDVLRTIGADHFAQVGWSHRFDAAEFYAELLLELRGRGL
ncbi:MAG TPA: alpha/beta fold hydrolase [Anaeromyxobacter sp.]